MDDCGDPLLDGGSTPPASTRPGEHAAREQQVPKERGNSTQRLTDARQSQKTRRDPDAGPEPMKPCPSKQSQDTAGRVPDVRPRGYTLYLDRTGVATAKPTTDEIGDAHTWEQLL